MQKFFLTTPIYYVNARPHIGHAYTTIVADVLARRARAQGIDTFFLTGTDEHGQKIERSAAAAGIPPQQFADEVSASFSTLWNRMGITHDDFIRTTSARHKRGVQKLFQTLKDNRKIELRSYTGSYCVSDEAFVDLPAGTPCPDCGRPLETVTEQNYFFKLSEYQLPLINLIESGELSIQPESRRNEVLSFLRGPVSTFEKEAAEKTLVIPSEEAEQTSVIPSEEAEKTPVIPSEEAEKTLVISSEVAEKTFVIPSEAAEKNPVLPSEAAEKTLVIPSEAAEKTLVILSEAKDPCISPSSKLPQIAFSALGTPYVPGALKDLSISRTSFKWGIPVPGDESHVIYVWLDALANYMTALGYGSEDDTLFRKFWPADLHIVGKEIIRFHCVYWPAFLLAANLPLPQQVVAHGWLLFEESKMSKSRGNIVRTETILDAFGPLCPAPPPLTTPDPTQNLVILSEAKDPCISSAPAQISTPEAALDPPPHQRDLFAADNIRKGTPSVVPQTPENEPLGRPRLQPWLSPGAAKAGLQPAGHSAADLKHHQDLFAADILRYFLLREIPFGQDGSFSFDALITRYNADLANGYGNLVSRTLKLIAQNFPNGFEVSPSEPWLCKDQTLDNGTTVSAGTERLIVDVAKKFGAITDDPQSPVALTDFLAEIQLRISAVDGYLSYWRPWIMVKIGENPAKLAEVLYTAAESIRIITLLLNPILPYATANVWAQLGLNPADLTSQDKQLRTENRELTTQWGGLKPGTKLGPLSPIFPRADKGLAQIMTDMEDPAPIACITTPNDPPTARLSAITEQHDATHPATDDLPTTSLASEAPSTDPSAPPRTANLAEPNPGQHVAASAAITTERPGTPHHSEAHASGIFAQPAQPADASSPITIEDFAKVELRVAQIVVCERIPKADKLLRLEVDLGNETRQILSGIAEWYTPEELLGRRIVVITNLAPRKMRGLESHGMLLAASAPAAEGESGGKPHLATFTDAETLPLGSRLK